MSSWNIFYSGFSKSLLRIEFDMWCRSHGKGWLIGGTRQSHHTTATQCRHASRLTLRCQSCVNPSVPILSRYRLLDIEMSPTCWSPSTEMSITQCLSVWLVSRYRSFDVNVLIVWYQDVYHIILSITVMLLYFYLWPSFHFLVCYSWFLVNWFSSKQNFSSASISAETSVELPTPLPHWHLCRRMIPSEYTFVIPFLDDFIHY